MLGYLISAAVYGVLLVACVTIWRRRLTGSGITAAVSAQLGWSVVLATEAAGVASVISLSIAIEYLRDLAWVLVLARSLRGSSDPRAVRAVQRIVAALVALVILGAGVGLMPGNAGFGSFFQSYGFWGTFALSIAGLVLVEQVARNTRSAYRWQLKYLWLGIGAVFAWDLCLFSIAMLRGSPAQDFWIARGFVNALVGVLLAVGLRRITGWESAAYLSPRVVFFNATPLAA